jgi:hypothetical protein
MLDNEVRATLSGVLPGTYLIIKYMPEWFNGNPRTEVIDGLFDGLKHNVDGTLDGVKLEGHEEVIKGRGIVSIHKRPARSAHRRVTLENGQKLDIFIDYKK